MSFQLKFAVADLVILGFSVEMRPTFNCQDLLSFFCRVVNSRDLETEVGFGKRRYGSQTVFSTRSLHGS